MRGLSVFFTARCALRGNICHVHAGTVHSYERAQNQDYGIIKAAKVTQDSQESVRTARIELFLVVESDSERIQSILADRNTIYNLVDCEKFCGL